MRLVLDPCSDVSTYMAVILGFILAERAVSLNKKHYQACKEIKKKVPKAWVLAENDTSANLGPVWEATRLCSM